MHSTVGDTVKHDKHNVMAKHVEWRNPTSFTQELGGSFWRHCWIASHTFRSKNNLRMYFLVWEVFWCFLSWQNPDETHPSPGKTEEQEVEEPLSKFCTSSNYLTSFILSLTTYDHFYVYIMPSFSTFQQAWIWILWIQHDSPLTVATLHLTPCSVGGILHEIGILPLLRPIPIRTGPQVGPAFFYICVRYFLEVSKIIAPENLPFRRGK